MNKTITAKKNYFYAALFLMFLLFQSIGISSTDKAAIDGSFITCDQCGFWSDARWQKEFTAMKNAGMHYMVIQAIASSYPGQATTTYYPSSLKNTKMAVSGSKTYPDVVDACLRNAQSAGVKVFIGINMSENWWNLYGNDTTWLYSQMELDNSICDEIWNNYKTKYQDAFYGWYWSYEVDNVNFKTAVQQNHLITAMNMQLDHLTSANERLPFMWCPFMNSKEGNAAAYQAMWQNVFAGLHTTAGDIFCPQDCVGAGGLKLNEVETWFNALRQAVNTKPGLLMWSDVETFTSTESISATLDRIVSQLKIEQPYVDNYITWEYCYYDSPNNIDPALQATYIDYLNTGVLESTPPTAPANITAVQQADGDIKITWDAATDNFGVCGYYVYRNGTLIGTSQVSKVSDSSNTIASLTSFKDTGLNPNTTYAYKIKAYDFANNISVSDSSINITTGNMTIVSKGCAYTFSVNPNTNYPDAQHKKLTDGKYAATAYYADEAWVGFADSTGGKIDVVIDLGKQAQVQYFTADYLFDPQPAVYLPDSVKVYLSSDKTAYTEAGTLALNTTVGTESATYKYYLTLANSVSARYVKFSTIASGYWTFCDELQVLNNGVSATEKEAGQVPVKFALYDAYPNPFNPATNIRFSITKAENVKLIVYNILGQKIRTLINKDMKAGTYTTAWDGKDETGKTIASGVYLYRLESQSYSAVKKMILMK